MLPSHNNNNVLLSISGAMNLPPDLSMDAGMKADGCSRLRESAPEPVRRSYSGVCLKVARKAKKVVNSPPSSEHI